METVARMTAWHAQESNAVFSQLDSHTEGLSAAEAARRLQRYGANKLPSAQQPSGWKRLFHQFDNVLVWVLLGAGMVTLLLGHYIDTAVIIGVTVVNALIGYVQEGRAEAALDAIRSMLTPTATVLRGGERQCVEAEQLVPGDVVLLAEGDKLPADLRLFEANALRIEEAALTGEAIPVDKRVDPVTADSVPGDRLCMAFSGTLVVHGQGLGVVVATGAATELGQISSMLTRVESLSTPLLEKMAQLGKVLTVAICLLAVMIFTAGVWLTNLLWEDVFMVAVGVAVAAIPEGLPAIVTISLAIGVQRMAGRNAIVRRLPAVETLGSVSVICTDKTGTLTCNEMTVQRVLTCEHVFEVGGVGYGPDGGIHLDGQRIDPREYAVLGELALAGLLCNDARVHDDGQGWHLHGDPTEGALCTLAMKTGLVHAEEMMRTPRLDLIPFAAEYRFMASLHEGVVYLKGAPEVVFERCNRVRSLSGDQALDLAFWEARNAELAGQGMRVLALASASVPPGHALNLDQLGHDFMLLGLVGIIDPPRSEVAGALENCRRAGIRVKMITGDHAITACAIGRKLGLGAPGFNTLTGVQIEGMSDEALRAAVHDIDIFARASPAHKLRLVEALQAQGAVVAMTGDGVNDAPALKRASVGVAMGQKGTEVAKEAAEMVLTDDNFASISHAVEEGRTVYENIRKSILFILPTNGGAVGGILIGIMLGTSLLITPVQILWVNMVTTVTLAISLAFLPAMQGNMQRAPRESDEPLLDGFLLWRIVLVSVLVTIACLGVFQMELAQGASLELARTSAVNMLVVSEAAYLFNCRDPEASVLTPDGLFGNRPAWISIAIVMPLQMAFTYLPVMQSLFATRGVSLMTWWVILMTGVGIFLCVELEKLLIRCLRGARLQRN